MKTKMNIITAKGVFEGLYVWGDGWKDNETANKWDEFWINLEGSNFWGVYSQEKFGPQHYLVGVSGSVYLHPMDFQLLLKKYGKSYKYENGGQKQIFPQIEELVELCKKCAEFCGGSFHLENFKIQEIIT